jgi:hypothetical protein
MADFWQAPQPLHTFKNPKKAVFDRLRGSKIGSGVVADGGKPPSTYNNVWNGRG